MFCWPLQSLSFIVDFFHQRNTNWLKFKFKETLLTVQTFNSLIFGLEPTKFL